MSVAIARTRKLRPSAVTVPLDELSAELGIETVLETSHECALLERALDGERATP